MKFASGVVAAATGDLRPLGVYRMRFKFANHFRYAASPCLSRSLLTHAAARGIMRKDDLMKADLFSNILVLTSGLVIVAAVLAVLLLSFGHAMAMR